MKVSVCIQRNVKSDGRVIYYAPQASVGRLGVALSKSAPQIHNPTIVERYAYEYPEVPQFILEIEVDTYDKWQGITINSFRVVWKR